MTVLDLSRLGGSDMPTLARVDPYGSRFALWARCVYGIAPPFSPDQEEAMSWGLRLEEPIFDAWCERKGIEPSVYVRNFSRVSAARSWQRVTPDFLVPPAINVQVKCVNAERFRREGWEDEVPLRIVAQVTAEIEALRSEASFWQDTHAVDPFAMLEANVAVLVGGARLREFVVPYDPELAGLLVDEAERFWKDYVEPRRLPPADATDACSNTIAQLHPRATEPLRAATPTEAEILRELSRVRREAKAIEETKQRLENELRAAIGDARGVEMPGLRATWSDVEGRTEWKRVAEELARKAGADLDAVCRAFRGAPSRRLEVRDV